MQHNQQYINAKLYGLLIDKGGEGLVATYAMLLYGRNQYHYYKPFKNSNNKTTKGKRLISKQSKISLTALNKYIPTLINLNLCRYTSDGGFFLSGRKYINQKLNKDKQVPIRIGKNLRETKGNVHAVKLIASAYRQSNQIDKKITLSKAYRRAENGQTVSVKESKMIKKFLKKNSTIKDLKKVENIVLSNVGIAKLIENDRNKNSKKFLSKHVAKGSYWRKVMTERGFIKTRRRYKTIIDKKMTYNQYLSCRNTLLDQYGFVTYKNNRIKKPISSELMVITNNLPYTHNTTILKGMANINTSL